MTTASPQTTQPLRIEVTYPYATRSCKAKESLWKKTQTLQTIKVAFGQDQIDMCKSLLLEYHTSLGPRYIMACMPSAQQLDLRELRAELPLSESARASLTLATKLKDITPRPRGAIAPTAPGIVDLVYFTRDFQEKQDHIYDIAIDLEHSFFMRGSDLLAHFEGDERYLAPQTDPKIHIVDWDPKSIGKPTKLDEATAGYPVDFSGAKVEYKGQPFIIKTPKRDEKECLATLPTTREQATLPIDYQTLLQLYQGGHHGS